MKSLKTNFMYNAVYQVLILIIPLITIPYVSRVIGSDGIGTYSYTYSIVYYFMICSMLGLNSYGNRKIAKVRDDKYLLSKTFKEIHGLQIITTIGMVVLYGIVLISYDGNMVYVFYAQSLHLLSCLFDINWFFFGLEEFKIPVFRNTLIKISTLILIFLFVRDSNDTIIYTLILSGGTLLSQLIIWPFVRKYITNVKINFSDIKKHFFPCLKLFLPVIAVTIYRFMDKTMIGLLSDIGEVGYYENAEKIINAPISIIYALGTIMLPRMSNMFEKNDKNEIEKLIHKSLVFAMFISFPMAMGLASVSQKFSILFFGEAFAKSGNIMILLSSTIILIGWGNVIRTQYLIPKEMDSVYIKSTFLGAILNVVLNAIFIPKYGAYGACVGTIFSEFMVTLYQTKKVKKYLPIKKYMIETLVFCMKSIIMTLIVILMGLIHMKSLYVILIQISMGFLIYIMLNYKYIKTFASVKKEKVIQ